MDRHLSGCTACREEQADFLLLMETSRKATLRAYPIADAVRNAVVREAAERAARGTWTSRLRVPVFAPVVPRPGWMAAAAAVLVALLTLPALLRREPVPSPEGGRGVAKLRVMTEAGQVRIAWTDGRKGTYTVYKSDSPRDFSRKDAHVVSGTAWTDTDPGSSPVVFYRVE